MGWAWSCAAGARFCAGSKQDPSGRTRCPYSSAWWRSSATTSGSELLMHLPMLSLLVLLPLAGSVAVLLLGQGRDALVRQAALAVSVLTFALSLVVWWQFNPASAD